MWLYIFDVFDKKVNDDGTETYVYQGAYNCVAESLSKAAVFASEDLTGDYKLVLRSTMMM